MLQGAVEIAPDGIHVGECESDINGDPSPVISPPLDYPPLCHYCH
jgi:hypothetical protein